MLTIRDLDNYTDKELYKMGKSSRDKLFKRVKRLSEAYNKEPENISKYGLEKMQEEGIPEISTKMHRNTMKANVLKLKKLESMQTSTVTGARKIQDRWIRAASNVPLEGRLNKEQRDAYNTFKDDFKQQLQNDEDLLATFWNGFKHYKKAVAYKKYDPERELTQYQEIFEDSLANGVNTIEDLRPVLKDIVEAEYKKEQLKQDLLKRQGRRGGFIND